MEIDVAATSTVTLMNMTRKFGQKMDNSTECLDMNSELWLFRKDYTTMPITMALFAFFYFTIIVFGITGNCCVLLAISRTKSLQTVPNMFIFSLSCSDLVVCCLSATITPITAFKKDWLFGDLMCTVAPWIAGISLCFSTFTLTAISIDRYILIKYPMKKPLSKKQALFIISGIVIAAAVICTPTAMKQKLTPFENFCGEYCTEDWQGDNAGRKLYGALLLTVQFVIPLSIIIISYSAISLRIGQSMILKSTQRKGSPTTGEWQAQLTDQQRAALKRRQRTNRMLIGMVVAFSSSWVWSVAYNLCRDYEMLPDAVISQEYLFGIATHCIAMTSTVWNPLLYALLNLQLRAAFINLMPNKLRHFLGVEFDEKSSPIGPNSEHPFKNGSVKLNRPPATTAICAQDNNGITRAKYGSTAQTVLKSYNTTTLNSSSNLSRASMRQRKPSAIRVIVSRLSASIADSITDPSQEDEVLLLEPSSSSDDDLRTRASPPRVSLTVISAPRRASDAAPVSIQRTLSPDSGIGPQLTRVNSF